MYWSDLHHAGQSIIFPMFLIDRIGKHSIYIEMRGFDG